MKSQKVHYKIIEDNENFAVVEWATKDGWGTKFYDCSNNPTDLVEFYHIKMKMKDEEWKDHQVGRLITDGLNVSIMA